MVSFSTKNIELTKLRNLQRQILECTRKKLIRFFNQKPKLKFDFSIPIIIIPYFFYDLLIISRALSFFCFFNARSKKILKNSQGFVFFIEEFTSYRAVTSPFFVAFSFSLFRIREDL